MGRLDTVRLLLDKGVPVDVKEFYTDCLATPLMRAAANGHYELSQLLLEREAAVDGTWRFRGTPIIMAAGGGYLRIVELLLDHGAELHHKFPHPLERAAENGQAHVVQFSWREAHS